MPELFLAGKRQPVEDNCDGEGLTETQDLMVAAQPQPVTDRMSEIYS